MTKDEALARLKELGVKPGVTLYTILRHVSKSGMQRRISVIHQTKEGPVELDYLIEALGIGKRKSLTRYGMSGDSWKSYEDGIVCGGCGMDMGFDLVYRLGRTMFPKGFKVPKGKSGRNGDTSGHDRDGGYALRQEWL